MVVDLPFWSLMTVVVFGFVTRFFSTVMDPTIAHYLYLGTLLWEIIRIAQYSMSLGVLWNVWSRPRVRRGRQVGPRSAPERLRAFRASPPS